MIYYKILEKGKMLSYGFVLTDREFKNIHSNCLKNETVLVLISKKEYEKLING